MTLLDLHERNFKSKYSDDDDIEDDEDYEYQHLKSIEQILEDNSSDFEDNEDNEEAETISKYKLITKRIDSNRIRHKIDNSLEIRTSTCKNVDFPVEGNVRSGAIIYTQYQGETYFCLGVDSAYGDLTDFAGGVKKTDVDFNGNPSVIVGGLRELQEESLGVFGPLTEKDIKNNLTFYSNNMLIMFIKLNVDMDEIRQNFLEKSKEKMQTVCGEFASNDLEVSDIQWLDKKDFLDSISCKGRRMYSRVRKILCRVTDIVSAL